MAVFVFYRYHREDKGATDIGFVDIPQGDEEALKAALATVGPVSIAIDASQSSFQFYSDGDLINLLTYSLTRILRIYNEFIR